MKRRILLVISLLSLIMQVLQLMVIEEFLSNFQIVPEGCQGIWIPIRY